MIWSETFIRKFGFSENVKSDPKIWFGTKTLFSPNVGFRPKMRFSCQFEICMLTISIFGDKTSLFGQIIFENWFLKVQDSNLRLLFKWYRLIVSSSTILNWVRLWDALNENDPWIRVDYLVSNPRIHSHSPFQVQ